MTVSSNPSSSGSSASAPASSGAAAGRALGLFEGYGVELEYMIVRRDDLSVAPAADRLLAAQAGKTVGDIDFRQISWSNELALHVIELKTNGPVAGLGGLSNAFDLQLWRMNNLLGLMPEKAMLLPTGMHPLMVPSKETLLWPHEYGEVYQTFDRIFDCRTHGWANMQSVHLNLPFRDEEEFGRLHAAVRMVLPILPGIAASSPVVEGRVTGVLDNRLAYYGRHCQRVPQLEGKVIPEPVFTYAAYRREILELAYQAIAQHVPDGSFCEEWVNARGAIARFERNTIEIRLLDVQECPAADLAVSALTAGVIRMLCQARTCTLPRQQQWRTEALVEQLQVTIRDGEKARILDRAYAAALGWDATAAPTVGELWASIVGRMAREQSAWLAPHAAAVQTILRHGPLARRILKALGLDHAREPADVDRGKLTDVYRLLGKCLGDGVMFRG
ncbi:MAG: hypothetical protein IT442_14970 [Phycisphaeraceae bacterium]|nr:hypothetical protein [Phycisphaeraceae bacterium]